MEQMILDLSVNSLGVEGGGVSSYPLGGPQGLGHRCLLPIIGALGARGTGPLEGGKLELGCRAAAYAWQWDSGFSFLLFWQVRGGSSLSEKIPDPLPLPANKEISLGLTSC